MLRNKYVVWQNWHSLQQGYDLHEVLNTAMHPDVSWHGFAPINTLAGVDALIAGFWRPFTESFSDLKRETHIFFGGSHKGDDWVTGYGYFRATFNRDWLGVPANGKPIHIRFGEFNRLHEGKISEVYMLIDVYDIMRQVGYGFLPAAKGTEGIAPPPSTRDGQIHTNTDAEITQKSFEVVHKMLHRGLNKYDGQDKHSMNQAQYWSPEMRWYGPSGIGMLEGLPAFEEHHQAPFLQAFPDRQITQQDTLITEGHYMAATGFPGITATHRGDYLGQKATDKPIQVNMMNWWRREDDLLVENWAMFDMVAFADQLGLDLFGRLEQAKAMRQC